MRVEEFKRSLAELWKKIITRIDKLLSVGLLGKEVNYPRREDIFLLVCIVSGILIYNFIPRDITGEGGLSIIVLTFIMVYGVIVHSSKNILSEIRGIKIWEILIGSALIIFSYFGVGIIKEHAGIKSSFGVSNTIVFLAGITMLFYGLRRLDKLWGFYALLIAIALSNIVFIGDSVFDDLAGEILAPLEAGWLSSLLNFLGYKTHVIYGREVSTVIFEDRYARVPIAGACTGIQGMTLYTTLTAGLLIGTKIAYRRRVVYLIVGALILFFLNFLRLLILSLVAYHYGMQKMYEVHEWLGGVIFMIFIVIFWILVIGRDLRKGVNTNVCPEGER